MKLVILDCEVYKNWFLASFRDHETGRTLMVELNEGGKLDISRIQRVMSSYTTVSFNGIHYDLPIIAYALTGKTTRQIKELSDAIIKNGLKSWQVEREFNFRIPTWDHIDLIEVAPGTASLKMYGARMGVKSIQSLPVDPDAELTQEQIDGIKAYCDNDLDITGRLYDTLRNEIELRVGFGKTINVDLRSKSWAQIAEIVIKEATGAKKPERVNDEIKFAAPKYMGFKTQGPRDILKLLQDVTFTLSPSGAFLVDGKPAAKTVFPKPIELFGKNYKLGIGGIHSVEKGKTYRSTSTHQIIDRDVNYYYPATILLNKVYPPHIGVGFQKIYNDLVQQRDVAKKAKDKILDPSLKWVINGVYGKFNDHWSVLYAPECLLKTTLTGQLTILMLIEALETAGIEVISANTDGIVFIQPNKKSELVSDIVHAWEVETGLVTEETLYSSYHARDVSNYVAVKDDCSVKRKGIFKIPGLDKNIEYPIISNAIVAYLCCGMPLETSIYNCEHLVDFTSCVKVNGGAVDADGVEIGKVARWYKSNNVDGFIKYKVNGYKVGGTDNCRSCIELPDTIPNDLNYSWYVEKAVKTLKEIGVNYGG